VNCNDANATFLSGIMAQVLGVSNYASGTVGRIDNSTTLPPYYNWGFVDELAFWSRALSAADIYTLCDSLPLKTTYDCFNGSCVNFGQGTGLFSDFEDCQLACQPLGLNGNQNITKKTLVRITDFLGRETLDTKNTVLFYIYDDGTVEKRILIE